MRGGYLKTDEIIDAFAKVPRVEFMPQRFRSASEADIPIPIGYGQIMAAPSAIAYMMELLTPQKGQSVLVVGFGTGWVSTMLSYITGPQGRVISCDNSEALEEDARKNMAKFSFLKNGYTIDLYTIDGCKSIPHNMTYDRIIVLNPCFSQCALQEWLSYGGIMVTPQNNVVHLYRRLDDGEMDLSVYSDKKFLPTQNVEYTAASIV